MNGEGRLPEPDPTSFNIYIRRIATRLAAFDVRSWNINCYPSLCRLKNQVSD